MDLREMADDQVVVVTLEDDSAKSAWPPWKHLLEDLADAQPPPTTIKLAYKNLGDAGAFRLAELLKGSLKEIRVLDISCTSIGSSGASAIANSIGGHMCLRAVDMSSNAVTDAGATAFSECLRTNTTLQSLCLHACLVGDKGATAMASALQGNTTLMELNLRQNYIDDAGAKALAPIIAQTSSLRVCDVQSNSYKRAGKAALNEAHAKNSRVDKTMPLSWQAQDLEGGDAVLARLAQPPRSLVSVDSATSLLGRKKPVGATNMNTQHSGVGKDAGASSLGAPSPKKKSGGGSFAAPSRLLGEEEHDDNAKPIRNNRGFRSRFAWLCGGAGGRIKLAMVRYLLFAAIVLATGTLFYISHQHFDAIEDDPKKGSGLLFEKKSRDVKQKANRLQADHASVLLSDRTGNSASPPATLKQ